MAGNIGTSAVAAGDNNGNYTFAFAVMTILFFIWGFITALNDILIPHLKGAFDLNYTQAMLVQFCFFGAYFIVSPAAGKLIEKIGYKGGVVTGLIAVAIGCGLFYPAAQVEVYAVFLLGLFTLASGITLLQVSANPYVSILGAARTAASRLNLAQAINSFGHTIAPLFGATLILGATASGEVADPKAVQLPYMMIAGAVVLAAATFYFMKLPVIKAVEEQTEASLHDSVWKHRPLVLGALAIFLYVGAEVTIGSFLVNFFSQPHIANMTEHQAGNMVSYYWGAAMIGRFIGAMATRYVQPVYVLAFNASIAVTLIIITVLSSGHTAMWSIVAVGFFNSVMFPTIFALAIHGLGPLTSRGSGLLCQAIVGGAVLPIIQGFVADMTSIQLSFIVPVFCYVYIGWYAFWGQHKRSPDATDAGKNVTS